MGIKFSNNASANIIQALTSTATSVSVTEGKGDLFPTITEGDYFYATLAGNNGLEIVKVTNRVKDTMTIVRAQDNTTALSFDTGDLFELRIVAADFNDTFSQVDSKLEDTVNQVTSLVEGSLEAIDDAVVHKTGTETIGGIKTFSNNLIIEKSTPTVYQKNKAYKKGDIPTSSQTWGTLFCESEGTSAVNRLGGLMTQVSANRGDVITKLLAYKQEAGSNDYTDIEIVHPKSGTPYATAPTTPADSTGNQIVTANYLQGTNSGVVHITGDETIAGIKTFTEAPVIKNAGPNLALMQTDIVKGTLPSSTQYATYSICDNGNAYVSNKRLLSVSSRVDSDGTVFANLQAYQFVANSTKNASIGVVYPLEGSPYGISPSTPAGSTGTQIVTADYLNGANSGVVHTTGDETITGAKTFTGSIIRESNGEETKIVIKNNGIPKENIAPSAQRFLTLRFYDAGGSSLGILAHQRKKDNEGITYITATSRTGGETAKIEVVAPASGAPYATAPTPDANSNTNHIATTKWVRGKGVLIESWREGTEWYRKYSDGWIEQGGYSDSAQNTELTISFHKPFSDANYTLLVSLSGTEPYNGSLYAGYFSTWGRTATSFKLYGYLTSSTIAKMWYACGY